MASLFDFLASDQFQKSTDLVSGILDYRSGQKATSAFKNAANSPVIDPFGSQRGYYQSLLQNYYGGGFDVNQVPGYSQAANEATRQAERSMAARGYNFAPGALAGEITRAVSPLALDASQEYNRMLAQLAGGNLAPNAGAFNDMQTRAIEQEMNKYSPITDALGLAGNIGKMKEFLQDPGGFITNMFGGAPGTSGPGQAGAMDFFSGGTGSPLNLGAGSAGTNAFSLNAANQFGGLGQGLSLGGGAGGFAINNSLGAGYAGSGFLPPGAGAFGQVGSGALNLAGTPTITSGVATAGAGAAGGVTGVAPSALTGMGAAIPLLGLAAMGGLIMSGKGRIAASKKAKGGMISSVYDQLGASGGTMDFPGAGTFTTAGLNPQMGHIPTLGADGNQSGWLMPSMEGQWSYESTADRQNRIDFQRSERTASSGGR